MSQHKTAWVVVGILIVAVVTSAIIGLTGGWRELIDGLAEAVDEREPKALIVFMGAFAVLTVFVVPGSWLCILGGFLFGFGLASIGASVGSAFGAAGAFLVGRFVFFRPVSAWVNRRPKLDRLVKMVGKKGFRVVLLTRLSPIFPSTLMNYGFAVAPIRFITFISASWLGMLPNLLLYCQLGALARVAGRIDGNEGPDVDPIWRLIVSGIWIFATIGIVAVLGRMAKQALHHDTGTTNPDPQKINQND